MNFFVNSISQKWVLILFDNYRNIVDKINMDILWNESEKLVNLIDRFLKKNKINYFDLENLVVVNWPGSFTWIRTIVLVINTINFIIRKNITCFCFFDLFKSYPIVKSSSKRDLFVKFDKKSSIEVFKNENFEKILRKNSFKKIYGDLNGLNIFDTYLSEKIDYDNIIKNMTFSNHKIIEPLYIKKPNIF